MNEQHFPPGDVAFQERYIEAFRGLTALMAARQIASDDAHTMSSLWWEMFDRLSGNDKDPLDTAVDVAEGVPDEPEH